MNWRLRIQVVLIFALGVVAVMSYGLMGPLTMDLQRAMHTTPQGVGAAFGVLSLPFLLLSGLIGGGADRLGIGRMLAVGSGLLVAANISNSLANSWAWLAINEFLLGAGATMILVTGQVALSRITSGRVQAITLSFWAAAPYVGTASGLLLSGGFAGGDFWRTPFAVQGALALTLGLAVVLLVRADTDAAPDARGAEGLAGHGHGGGRSLRAVWREVDAIRLGLALMLISLTSTGSLAVWSFHLVEVHQVPVSKISSMSAAASVGAIGGAVMTGFLLARRLPVPLLLIAYVALAMVSTVVLYSPASSLPLVGVAMIFWSIGVSATMALIFATLPQKVRNPGNLGLSAGIVLQLSGIGGVCGAPLFFAVATLEQASMIFIAGIVGAWAILAILMPVWRGGRTIAAGGGPGGNDRPPGR